jgi:glycerol-3-phosphate O-acyltransferase
MKDENKTYPHVFPDMEEWPIYKMHQDRKRFVQQIDEQTLSRLMERHGVKILDIVAKTIYEERIRIKEEVWKVDPPNEKQFWKKVRSRLLSILPSEQQEEEVRSASEELLRTVIHRYSEEIVATFRIKTFLFARKFLTLFFNSLLYSSISLKSFWWVKAGQAKAQNRLLVKGYIDQVRALMKKGTVVLVPTHFSNLDSILIGYGMDLIGLPSFSYGAGLNLYNTGYTAYFMNRLGTYRVDRRKKNPIYLETLKTMSKLSIERGTNSLFFPGGTRSRAGKIEDRLKLGLLSTVIEAQRSNYQKGEDTKIFIVPVVLSYHFILEAQFLVEQHLRRMGKERYLKTKDYFLSLRKIIKFAWQVISEGNEIIISMGRPMDVVGNPVDEQGESIDQFGHQLDIKDYFLLNGQIKTDYQRESEYTKILADAIVDRYHKDNIVLSSHLVAFAAFKFLQNRNTKLDLYGLLRLPPNEYVFPMEGLKDIVGQLRGVLLKMEKKGHIQLSDPLHGDLEALIKDGIKRLGNFHLAKPLKWNKKGQIMSENFKLLYFYHNRLDSYGLEKKIKWKSYQLELI